MAAIAEVEDESGAVLAELYDNHDVYFFNEGQEQAIPARPAWCHVCETFVLAEQFIDPEEHVAWQRKQIDAMGYGSSKTWREGKFEAWLRSFKLNRISPPRCLECGKHDFIILEHDGRWMKHPLDPTRKIRCQFVAFADMATAPRRFDLEGIALSQRK